MSSNKEILQTAIIGIPRVAERIAKLSEEQRQQALDAVERSYLRTVFDADYPEDEGRQWVDKCMESLRAEVAEQTRNESEVTVGCDSFTSLERTMRLLVRAGSATD
jgi:selenocysteine lyase/cysteine desulfurase